MNAHAFTLSGASLIARPTGTLHWPDHALLCVSDLHLGKAERIARRGGGMLPPYETRDTLARLECEIAATGARRVVCLGDSFDDLAALEALPADLRSWLLRMMAGRDWTWIAGNHDPGPISLGGSHRGALVLDGLTFRHVAGPQEGEVSGHYHPKLTMTCGGRTLSRACFLIDSARVVMPAFGTYTGGMRCTDPVLRALMGPDARVVLTGATAHVLPLVSRPAPRPARQHSDRPRAHRSA